MNNNKKMNNTRKPRITMTKQFDGALEKLQNAYGISDEEMREMARGVPPSSKYCSDKKTEKPKRITTYSNFCSEYSGRGLTKQQLSELWKEAKNDEYSKYYVPQRRTYMPGEIMEGGKKVMGPNGRPLKIGSRKHNDMVNAFNGNVN